MGRLGRFFFALESNGYRKRQAVAWADLTDIEREIELAKRRAARRTTTHWRCIAAARTRAEGVASFFNKDLVANIAGRGHDNNLVEAGINNTAVGVV